MLEKPNIPDNDILVGLRNQYGILAGSITFLPLGADVNTAVYEAVSTSGIPYFVKLRSGIFDEMSVKLPKYLSDQGLAQIIAPIPSITGQLWADLEGFRLILYPFIQGRDAYEVVLTERHWFEFGTALKQLHTTELPPTLKANLLQETFSSHTRDDVRKFLIGLDQDQFRDPIAEKLAAFLKTKQSAIVDLVSRAEHLARQLQAEPLEFVLCHTDVHAGNLHIADDSDQLFIVDWDNPLLAPKERDLMFIGGAQGFRGHHSESEHALFYRGYGPTERNEAALAYYRYERIILDISAYCQQLFLSNEGGDDREQSLHYLMSNFRPGGTIETAYRADKT